MHTPHFLNNSVDYLPLVRVEVRPDSLRPVLLETGAAAEKEFGLHALAALAIKERRKRRPVLTHHTGVEKQLVVGGVIVIHGSVRDI